MRTLYSMLFITVITVNTYSQSHDLGDVTIDELKEKVCPSDTSAPAAVLFTIGKSHFDYSHEEGFELVTEIFTKIKIYKKEGYGLADQVVSYYSGNRGSEKVGVSKAVTFNLVNNKIEKSKLRGDGEFDEKANKHWMRKKFTMPNVKEGSIIEFKIEIKSHYIHNLPDWEFQKRIPVNYTEYTTCIPEYYLYNTYFKGVASPEITKDGKSRRLDYTYVEDAVPGLNGHAAARHNSTLEFNESITKYVLTNVPALKQEAFVNNIDNYRLTLIHELAGTRYPNSPFENFSTDWESVVKKIYDNEDFGSELNKTGYFDNDIDQALTGLTKPEERVAAIFNFVKERMNWDGTNRFNCEAGVRKAYQDRKGNSAEINLMLTSMLRYAGFDANPVLLSTRSNGVSVYPSITAFNYVIAGLELENQVVLLDATSKYSVPDILPFESLNWFGRIIRKGGSSALIDLMPKTNSKDIINIMGSIATTGEVSGKIREQYFDYNAFYFRELYASVSTDSYIEKLEKKHQGLEVSDYALQNKLDLSKPIIENYAFTSSNAVETIADKMYFSPFLFFSTTENPFKQEVREYPIDFIFPHQDKFNVSLNIPEGYVVETLPQNKAIGMPDNIGNFKFNISNTGNQIQMLFTCDINQAIVNPDKYEILKNFFKEMVAVQTEKIVLKKI